MSNQGRKGFSIIGGRIHGNGGDGISIEGTPIPIHIEGVDISGNRGRGVNVSNEPKEPKNGKDAGNNGSKFSRFVDKLVWPVSAGLVLASILGGFAYVRPNFGF